MEEILNRAKKLLKEQNLSFVAINNSEIITSDKKGVAPIMELIGQNNRLISGAIVADKVIGGAAAFLLVKCGVSYIYGEIMSEKAISVLQKYNVPYSYGNLVPYIKNRRGDGLCPMEQLCLDVHTPDEAYEKIKEFINSQTPGR
jgi:hypothetical protein